MNTLTIDIINPKAEKLLKDLAELNLITIKTNDENGFTKMLKKLRSNKSKVISFDDITKEVEKVRAKRYEKEKN